MSNFCSLWVSISLIGYALCYFGHFTHNATIVVPSFSFLNVLKSCDLVLFSFRKMQKRKKNVVLFNIFYLKSPVLITPPHIPTGFQQFFQKRHFNISFFLWTPTGLVLDSYWTPTGLEQNTRKWIHCWILESYWIPTEVSYNLLLQNLRAKLRSCD